jgi:hypothetical protein
MLITTPHHDGCRASHPLTRLRCEYGYYEHDFHSTVRSGWWDTSTGRTSSPVGTIVLRHYALFVSRPGHPSDLDLEIFHDATRLRHELARRITYGYGTHHGTHRPGTVRYDRVEPDAYMDVWVWPAATAPPDQGLNPPTERWWADTRGASVRSEYLAVTTPYHPMERRTP